VIPLSSISKGREGKEKDKHGITMVAGKHQKHEKTTKKN
jgi:hypothetical protein